MSHGGRRWLHEGQRSSSLLFPFGKPLRWQDICPTRLQATTLTFTGNDLAPASPLNIVFYSSITFSSEVVAVRPAGRSSFGVIAHPLALAAAISLWDNLSLGGWPGSSIRKLGKPINQQHRNR
jgi:hypothetical protein